MLLAQSDTGVTIDSALTVINLGLAGVGLLAFVRGWIVPGKTYEEALKREKEAREQNEELNKAINEKFLPELQRSRSVQVALGQLIDRIVTFIETKED